METTLSFARTAFFGNIFRVVRAIERWGGVALAVAGMAVLAAACWPWTVDDAFIVARYAERLAGGHGWTMNDGPATDGVTSPLWLTLVALGAFLANPIAWAKVLGCIAALGAVAWSILRVRRRALGKRGAWFAAVFLAPQSSFAYWSVAGLETGIAALALTATALGGRWLGALGAFAMAWIRPECVPAALVLAAARREHRALRVACALGGAVGVSVCRLAMFGDPLPLALHAKPGDLSLGMQYAAFGLLATTGIGWGVLCTRGCNRGRCLDRAILMAAVVHIASVVAAGGDWMPGYRLLVPMLPLLALPVATGATLPWSRKWCQTPILVIVGFLVVGIDAAVQLPRVRDAGVARASAGKALVNAVRRSGGPVALVDVGFIGYETKLEVVDLGGVTDPSIARLPGGYLNKVIDDGYLEARAPRTLLLHSATPPRVSEEGELLSLRGYGVEQRLAGSEWVKARFRVRRVIRYSHGYYYVVMGAGADAATDTGTDSGTGKNG